MTHPYGWVELLYICSNLFFGCGAFGLLFLFSVVDDHTCNSKDDLDTVSDKGTEGAGADVIGTPEAHIYKSPEAVLLAVLLTDTHDKGQ